MKFFKFFLLTICGIVTCFSITSCSSSNKEEDLKPIYEQFSDLMKFDGPYEIKQYEDANLYIAYALDYNTEKFKFIVYDKQKKSVILSKVCNENFPSTKSFHVGYGEYQERTARLIEPKLFEIDQRCILPIGVCYSDYPAYNYFVFFDKNGTNVKCLDASDLEYKEGYDIIQWYGDSYLILAYRAISYISCINEDKVIFKNIDGFKINNLVLGFDSDKDLLYPLSAKEGIFLSASYYPWRISKFSITDKWNTEWNTNLDFLSEKYNTGNERFKFETVKQDGSILHCVMHIIKYSGETSDVNFTVNINNGEVSE